MSDDINLMRNLIKQFLLLENYEETNKLYQNWKIIFQNDVKKIDKSEYKKIFQNHPPPNDYAQYNDWLNQKVDLFSNRTINDIINILNGTVVKFKINIKNNINNKENNLLNQGFVTFNASSIIKDQSLLLNAKNETRYCEELIAEILRQSGILDAKRTMGQYDLYDIESSKGIFEVKSMWADKEIRAGVSSEEIGINFRNLLVSAVDQILGFNNCIDKINLNDEIFIKLKNEFKYKIQELYEKGRSSSNTNLYDLRKGNIPLTRSNLVLDLIKMSENLRNILNKFSNDNEKLSIDGNNIHLDTPQKKMVYYEIIKKLKNLGVAIEVDENDFNYATSAFEYNLSEKINNFIQNELIPRKSFREDLEGLFIVHDDSNDPVISYINEKYINEKLEYKRTTIEKGRVRIKFGFKQ